MEMDTAEVCLRLLLNLTPLFTEDRQEAIDAVVPRLRRICDVAKTSASCSSLAKVAAKCLTALQATDLAPQIAGELDSLVADAVKISSGSELCVPRLDALGQILKQSALKYQSKVANLVAKRLPEFVRQAPSSSAGGAAAAGSRSKSTAASSARDLSRWSPTESLSHLAQVKLASIRCLCHYLIGLASASAASSSAAADCTSDTAQSIVDLFHQIILYDGNPSSSSSSGKGAKLEAGEMAQMRVCAAKALLRVCKRQALVPLLDCERFQTLALTVCDPCKEVRHAVLGKLHRGLVKFKLPLQFMAMFAYVPEAAEDKELLQTARTYYSRCVAARREYLASKQSVIANDRVTFFAVLPDYTLPYAVHLLANDPEFESPKDAKQLARLKSGLRFLLEPLIAKGENFGFLRRMLETMRLARDAQRPDDELANKKLHAVCDLALGLIVTKSTNFSISNYPIEPQLPKRLFLLPANREATVAAEFASLPAGVQFSPPKNPAAIQQGLIPKDRVRLGKRAAAAAAAANAANLSNISTMAKSPPSAPAAKSTPAVQQSKRDEQQPSTVAKNPPAKSPIKSPLKSATTSTESPVASATSAATKKKQAQQRGAAASQNGRSAAAVPSKTAASKAATSKATVISRKRRAVAMVSPTDESSAASQEASSPAPSPSPKKRRRGLAVAVASPSTLSTTPTPGSGSGSGVSSGRLSRAAKSRSIEALSR
uniref:Sister chromatid cohesion protein n=1 Tax=Macrostomum lignano TaxID=282301 RepID=A0A1I8G4M6_9PLAT